MDLLELVKVFNGLRRTPKTPSGLVDNHWHFAVCHVPLPPAGDVLHIVNPPSRYSHSGGGSVQILSLESMAARASVILPLLLKAFVTDMGNQHDDPRAPWSWGTEDPDLAKALESAMKAAGVRKDLCTVKIGDQESIRIQKEVWATVLAEIGRQAGPRCSGCNKLGEPGAQKLLFCAGCKTAKYCSRDCQKAHWKAQHKIACKYFAKDPSIDAVDFYQICSTLPDAQALAREIGLSLPGQPGANQGLKSPIRRLVVTGKDTPENIAILLGRGSSDQVASTWKETRLEVLLRPQPGSPMFAMSYGLNLDNNCPSWTPRDASPAEAAEIQKIRDMQRKITEYMGSRSMSSITSQDMVTFLTAHYPDTWSSELQCYMAAINSMDQGVGVGRR